MRVLTPRLLAVLEPEATVKARRPHASPGSARSSHAAAGRHSGTSATLGGAHAAQAGVTAETARCGGRSALGSSAAPVQADGEGDKMRRDDDSGPFDLLHTERGFAAFEQWYRRILSSGTSGNAVPSPRPELGFLWPQVYCPPNALHEHAFLELVRAFADCSDGEAFDFFDLLDHDSKGVLGLQQVYIAICLLAAVGCRQLTKFIYYHSTRLFGMLAQGCRLNAAPEHVIWAKVLVLLRLLGTSGHQISKVCADNDMTPLAQLKYDDFLNIMFPIMAHLDRGIEAGEITVINEGDRSGHVRSKMCTIL